MQTHLVLAPANSQRMSFALATPLTSLCWPGNAENTVLGGCVQVAVCVCSHTVKADKAAGHHTHSTAVTPHSTPRH